MKKMSATFKKVFNTKKRAPGPNPNTGRGVATKTLNMY
jgi:hypothetical protein